jgi:hypothetical protein
MFKGLDAHTEKEMIWLGWDCWDIAAPARRMMKRRFYC